MRTVVALASGTVIGLAAVAGVASGGASVAAPAVVPFAAEAPDTPAMPTGTGTPPACVSPAPVKTYAYYHCYGPNEVRAAHGLPALATTSTEGAGQTIVLVDSYGSPTAEADLATFASSFGGPAPSVEQWFPQGEPGFPTTTVNGNGSSQSGPAAAAGWAGEAALDVEWAYALAPAAHIVLLAVPPAETQGVPGLPNLMNAIDKAIDRFPAGTVFSMSFGTDESAFASPAAAKVAFARFDQTFAKGDAKGDTFFASSGDAGSVGVTRAHRQTATSPDPQVSYPNVSPYVTSVGGTQLQYGWTWDPTSDTPFLADGSLNPDYFAWNSGGSSEPVDNEGWAGLVTGGGLSTVYPRPAYQDAVAGVVGDHRGVPDLSWNSSVNGGVLVYTSFFPGVNRLGWHLYGGTSASSPQAAALTALANQQRIAAQKAPLGNLNSVIYSTAFPRGAAFTDVVPSTYGTTPSGHLDTNRVWDIGADGALTPDPVPGYPTTDGYDLTTGWGVPAGPTYVAALVAAP
ncbi:MAG TPA: S53 family peptidase [Cellulomonas sp.]|uniref:S53 family peptidase n=1 Tax=Cellulomonas sp. TaxID=40001 RepID=UPI002E359192|nr:S53 family peptidase [Cellulomonas sp.]HEX5333922.1 S53 family peptidase [Cellulomonas sp.]